MELKGLSKAEFLFYRNKDDAQPDVSTYEFADNTKGFPTTAQIQNLSGSSTPEYGGNVIAYQQSSGNGAVSGSFDALDLPKALIDKLMGYTVDANGISHHGSKTVAPYVAVVFTSLNAEGDKEAWMGLPKVVFSRGDVQAQTNTNDPVTNHDQLTFNAMNRDDGDIYLEGYEDGTTTAAMFRSAVFGADPVTAPTNP